MSEAELSKMKVADLKLELKKRGLTTTGNKTDLIERLMTASSGKDWLLDDTLDHEDDLLDDEELEKDLLSDHEDELLNPSPPKSATKQTAPSAEPAPIAKKVSLKRNLSIPAVIETPKPAVVSEGEEPAKKVIKLAELTEEDRIKIRAQKFGASAPAAGGTAPAASVTSVERKLARAARFGISSPPGGTATERSGNSIKNSAPAVDIEVLKKRAERFGATTATTLNKAEQEEKLKKRQERFGAAASESSKADLAAKAQQRLERFKMAA